MNVAGNLICDSIITATFHCKKKALGINVGLPFSSIAYQQQLLVFNREFFIIFFGVTIIAEIVVLCPQFYKIVPNITNVTCALPGVCLKKDGALRSNLRLYASNQSLKADLDLSLQQSSNCSNCSAVSMISSSNTTLNFQSYFFHRM